MDALSAQWLVVLAGAGVVGGLLLLLRGLDGYRTHLRVADISTSSIDTIAAGEVRVSGVVEPAELTLVSLLQNRQCVYYRATVGDAGERRRPDPGYTEERSIGFRVRDASGSLRVFPREARFDAPVRFEGQTGTLGDEPAGLDLRRGGSTRGGEVDQAVAAAELLRVHAPWEWSALAGVGDRDGRRSYRETRLEPGDEVTIIGWALPFSDLPDPAGANLGDGSGTTADDPEVNADLAAARASGSLADDPAQAWGNAAIPGFGIGRPATEPAIDPAANRLPLASPDEVARSHRTFVIAPETLVLAAADEVPLLIAYGTPGAVVRRSHSQLLLGLLGAVVAIVSAMVLAIELNGGFAT
jgi:hypothetical protein